MANAQTSVEPTLGAPGEDRTLAFVIYGLYLLGLVNGLTIVVGLMVAYANRDSAAPRARSHYIFQIRTFWTAIGWWIIGGLLIGLGAMLTAMIIFALIGVPMMILGAAIFGVGHIWFLVRCILGLVYLAQDEAYPRPRSWLF